MDQEDFRQLLSTSSSRPAAAQNTKRSRAEAFGGPRQRQTTKSSASSLAPRTVKGGTSSKARDNDKGRVSSRVKLADGYTDRAKQRGQDSESNTAQQRIDALKQELQEKRITHKDYLARVNELSGGDFAGAGLARGLDRKLLERVRAGEDVLSGKAEEEQLAADLAQAEEELEHVVQRPVEKLEQSPQETSGTRNVTRDELLARFKSEHGKSSAATAAQTPQEAVRARPAGFKPITKRNVDGTTTETIIEDGKKVKIIRSAEGVIIKKLVKKADKQQSDVPLPEPAPAKALSKQQSPETTSTMAPVDVPEEEAEDIFADVGEYDPFAETSVEDTARPIAGPYFCTKPDEEESEMRPTTTEEFMRLHEETLQKAAKIVDRQSKADQARFSARKRQDAGFGLVFADGDAYAGDVREVPEDDEMYVRRQRKGPKASNDVEES